MTVATIETLAQTLAAALSRRLDLSDDQDMAALVDEHVQSQVLQNYREQLTELEGPDAIAWLLRRMATIEARLIMLGHAAIHPTADGADPVASDNPLLLREASLPFDADLVQSGFYAVEVGDEGTSFRWLGPDPQASVFLPKMAAPVEIRVEVWSAFLPEVLDKVRLSLDGGESAGVSVETRGDRHTLTAVVTPGPISHAGSMRLDIDAVRTETPSARGEPDSRHLALAILRIDARTVD